MKNKAFTLVELLVVLAILFIVAGIIFSVANHLDENSNTKYIPSVGTVTVFEIEGKRWIKYNGKIQPLEQFSNLAEKP